MTRMFVIPLLGALALTPLPALTAEEAHSVEELAVELAQTPEQHEVVARHYRAQAEAARAEMERHQRMASMYGGGKLRQRQRMQSHCTGIAGKYADLAKEYDGLAELHEEAAKGAQ